MKYGDIVNYVGRGFIGFDLADKKMTVISVDGRDIWVEYKGRKMLVLDHEVKNID